MWIARLTATSPHTHSPAKSQTFFTQISTSKPIAQTQTWIGNYLDKHGSTRNKKPRKHWTKLGFVYPAKSSGIRCFV